MRRFAKVSVGFLVLAIGVGPGGCSTGGSSANEESAITPGTPGEGVTLTVKNEQRIEADIWVFVDGATQRLGRVNAFGEETFLIPLDRARTLRLEFRLFGGATCVTRETSRLPGEAVSYTIPVDIRLFDAVCRGI